jgi:hypothetical protein
MPSQLVTTGLDQLDGKLRSLRAADFKPLMLRWRAVLEEDNTAGALAGLNGFGGTLRPVTYRPRPARGPVNMAPLRNDNLRSSAYRVLSGPPLAPRGVQSRIIKNYRTADDMEPPRRWIALGAWQDVLSTNDVPFLPFHFRGEGNLPRRDLAHVRPDALKKAREALRAYVKWLLSK